MNRHVFTYGSLMFPRVWSLVVAGRYRSVVGSLDGHARFAVDEQDYPGMVLRSDASVEGVLYLDVDDADLDRLDRFEGDDYRRASVDVATPEGTMRCETYVYLRPERLLAESWDPAAFALQRFIDTYCRERLGP